MNNERRIEVLRHAAAYLASDKATDRITKDGYGLCLLIDKAEVGYGSGYVDEMKTEAFEKWEHFSGSVCYPIPHPWTAEQRAEYNNGMPADMTVKTDAKWAELAFDFINTENGDLDDASTYAAFDRDAAERYIELRLDLRDHLVQCFRKIADELEQKSQ